MPGQDQIIGGMSSNGLPHNVIRGAQQTLEMNHGVNMDGVEGEEEQSSHNHGASQELRAREQEWANELRRADERSHEVRQRCEDLKKANSELEARCKAQEQQIETRDVEILRLGGLYQGGQNNDKLAMQYSQEQNQKIVGKLNAQLDFLNKENHRLQTQLDLFVKDKSVVAHIDKYRADIDDLTFENQTLRKDLRELTATLKDYQEADFHRQREARALADQQQASEREVDKQRQEVQQAREAAESHSARMNELTCEFNAERRCLKEKITMLEQTLTTYQTQFSEMQSALDNRQHAEEMQRNELNLWNGRAANIKRDLDMQQNFNAKVIAENKDLKATLEEAARKLAVKDQKERLLAHQIQCLQEDNDRLAKMYT